MRLRPLPLLFALLATAASAAEPPPALFEMTEESSAMCREAGGTPHIRPGYQTVLDLNGDGRDDFVTDLAHLECENAWSLFCGSAGCPVSAWLSEPDGSHVAFPFGHLQAFEMAEGPDGLPAIRAFYHGAFCEEGRAGIDGCSRTWVFATNAPETPPIDEPAAGEPPAETAEPAAEPAAAAAPPAPEPQAAAPEPEAPAATPPAPIEPVAPGWTLRDVPGTSPVALGGGTGRIASFAAFCFEGQPFLALTFVEAPDAPAVEAVFGFGDGPVAVEAAHEATAGGAYVVALAGSPLAARLAGRDREAGIRIGDRDEGTLSLSGSTRAVRAALETCHRF